MLTNLENLELQSEDFVNKFRDLNLKTKKGITTREVRCTLEFKYPEIP